MYCFINIRYTQSYSVLLTIQNMTGFEKYRAIKRVWYLIILMRFI